MPVDARVIKDSRIVGDMNKSLARSAAQEAGLVPDFASGSTMFERKPDYYVYVWNISKQSFPVNQPLFKIRTIVACPDGAPYIEVARFPNIVLENFVSAETGQMSRNEYSGEHVAMDLIRPGNPSTNLDASLSQDAIMTGAETTDLVKRGLFITVGYEPPREEDIQKARGRMESWYRRCIATAQALARAGKQQDITSEMHLAADHFRIKESWHVIAEMPENCPNCGEEIKKGVAYHKSAEGIICVVDWKRAVAAGVKRREDVPVDARWWTEETVRK